MSSSETSVTASPRIAIEAAASQPMKPEPITVASVWISTHSRSARASARLRRTSESPGIGSRFGSEPVASTQASKCSSSSRSVT